MELTGCTCMKPWFSVLPPPPCPVHVGRDPFATQPIPIIQRWWTSPDDIGKEAPDDDA